jgi:hypothetical protein
MLTQTAIPSALSRNQGVTIFVSTHFMNEAARCDRVSLMDSGWVLATDTPAGLTKARGAATLEDAFISYLEEAMMARPGRTKPTAGVLLRQHRRCQRQRFGNPQPDGRSAFSDFSPTPSAKVWSFCAIRSGLALPCSELPC